MKKKLFVLSFSALLTACSGSDKAADTAADNAVKYAKESVFDKMIGVKSVEVTATDSVLTDDMIDEAAIETLADGVANGAIHEDSLRNALDNAGSVIYDIWSTWRGGARRDGVRGKYTGRWHIVYTVTATMESGAQHDVTVLMDTDRTTPMMNGDEYAQKQREKKGVLQALTRELVW